jgi:hypothetical protein
MWTKEREGIGVTAVQESVNFGIIANVHGDYLRGCVALFLRLLGFSGLLRQ